MYSHDFIAIKDYLDQALCHSFRETGEAKEAVASTQHEGFRVVSPQGTAEAAPG